MNKYSRNKIEEAIINTFSHFMKTSPEDITVKNSVDSFMKTLCEYQGVANNKWVKTFIDKCHLEDTLNIYTNCNEQIFFYNEIEGSNSKKYVHLNLMLTKSNMVKFEKLSKNLSHEKIIENLILDFLKNISNADKLNPPFYWCDEGITEGIFYVDLYTASKLEHYVFQNEYTTITDLECVMENIINYMLSKC